MILTRSKPLASCSVIRLYSRVKQCKNHSFAVRSAVSSITESVTSSGTPEGAYELNWTPTTSGKYY